MIKAQQKQLVLTAWDFCLHNPKSLELTIKYIMKESGLDREEVVSYMTSSETAKDFSEYYRKLGRTRLAKLFKP